MPHAHDAANSKPSVRLLFAYIAFLVAIISIVALHKHKDLLVATWTAIAFYCICTVLYMFKGVTSFKADLDDQSLEIGDSTENKKEN